MLRIVLIICTSYSLLQCCEVFEEKIYDATNKNTYAKNYDYLLNVTELGRAAIAGDITKLETSLKGIWFCKSTWSLLEVGLKLLEVFAWSVCLKCAWSLLKACLRSCSSSWIFKPARTHKIYGKRTAAITNLSLISNWLLRLSVNYFIGWQVYSCFIFWADYAAEFYLSHKQRN